MNHGSGYDESREEFAMAPITLEQAQALLPDLVHSLKPGENVVIVENGKALAVVTKAGPEAIGETPGLNRTRRQLGTMRGTVLSMDGFNDPLEEFEDYGP